MNATLNLQGKLNFSNIDSVPPEKIVEETANQVEAQTNSILMCDIKPYEASLNDGKSSFNIKGIFEHDVQMSLGEQGYEKKAFELYLISKELPHYKFRILVFEYGIGGYPVHIILEQKIADEIQGRKNAPYVFDADNRGALENMITMALSTDRMINIMQELINATYLGKINAG